MDDIIKYLKDEIETSNNHRNGLGVLLSVEHAKLIVSLLENNLTDHIKIIKTKHKWISVNELPSNNETVIIAYKKDGEFEYTTASYNGDKWNIEVDIQYWKPIN